MTDQSTAHPVDTIAARLTAAAQNGDTTVGAVIAKFGRTAFATCLLVPSLVLASPLSGIPFASTVLGALICLIAAQAAFGAGAIWLPDAIKRRSVSAARVTQFETTLRRFGALFSRFSRVRLQLFVGAIARRGLYAICAVAGAILPVLEVVPFSSSLVGAGIAVTMLGVLGRDGLFALLGVPLIVAGLSLPVFVVSAVLG